MAQKKGFDALKEKVPELRTPWRMAASFVILILSTLAFITLFWRLDRLLTYGPLVSQLIVAAWLSVAQYYSMRHLVYRIRVKCKETGTLPRWVLPAEFALIFAPWYACLIHPLLVVGEALLPSWIAVSLGLLIIFSSLLMRRPAILGGFTLTHSLSIYLFFPEDGSRVSRGIYSYLRHPSYAMGIYICFGFASLRNNLLAILTALIFAVTHSLAVKLEDEELIKRFGEEHRRYISETPAIFPRLEDLGGFARLLFLGEVLSKKGHGKNR